MKEVRVRVWLMRWLGVTGTQDVTISLRESLNKASGRLDAHAEQMQEWRMKLEELIFELRGRIDDLEAAYPDYKKAKAESDEKKANEIVPGFTPYTQRKRRWEAEHRKPAPKQKS